MKTSYKVFAGVLAFSGLTSGAIGACTPPYMNGSSATSLLSGNTVCSPANCSGTSCKWQEQHRTNGELWDYKKGSNHPVDPTSKEGSWSVANNGKVTNSYAGGSSYTYDIKDNGSGSYSFCGGPAEIFFSVKSGVAAGCP